MEPLYPVCPVCRTPLERRDRTLVCRNGHCFDLAKEGYCNLLTAQHRAGETTGDNNRMAQARSAFLNKGCFAPLAAAVTDFVRGAAPQSVVLDICCGEGYYSEAVLRQVPCRLLGFDLSKAMVRRAAKRGCSGFFFVANLSAIPLPDGSVDRAFHLFAPFHAPEFARVLRPGGLLCTVMPGPDHLFALKAAVYASPYRNEVRLPDAAPLRLLNVRTVRADCTLTSNEDIRALFDMTPYRYRTSPADLKKLDALQTLTTPLEFVLAVYQKQ
ncbi:MAG: methyltransferase domain-containing protein [Clostridia bacterium]|nr:methyltransferase domain-containing protein [Clostridia bacterium]MBR3552225.1 methyltransferase domain-containing protein [Clostridia bacterium]